MEGEPGATREELLAAADAVFHRAELVPPTRRGFQNREKWGGNGCPRPWRGCSRTSPNIRNGTSAGEAETIKKLWR